MKKESAEWRFWSKVRIASGCWEWMASRNRDGYGQFNYNGKMRKAHRVAYLLIIGNLPDDLQLDHVCHNRGCVNPDHLRPCSNQENSWNGLGSKSNPVGLKGVTKHSSGKWQARIGVNRQIIHLGTFDSPEEAHSAYCVAAKHYFGDFACDGVA